MAWTDDRMDDLARQMADGFARTDHQIAALRAEAKSDNEKLRAEIKAVDSSLRTEIKNVNDSLHADIAGLHKLMFYFCFGLIAALIGLVGALAVVLFQLAPSGSPLTP